MAPGRRIGRCASRPVRAATRGFLVRRRACSSKIRGRAFGRLRQFHAPFAARRCAAKLTARRSRFANCRRATPDAARPRSLSIDPQTRSPDARSPRHDPHDTIPTTRSPDAYPCCRPSRVDGCAAHPRNLIFLGLGCPAQIDALWNFGRAGDLAEGRAWHLRRSPGDRAQSGATAASIVDVGDQERAVAACRAVGWDGKARLLHGKHHALIQLRVPGTPDELHFGEIAGLGQK